MAVAGKKRTLWVFQIHIIPNGHLRAAIVLPPGAKGRRPLIRGWEGECAFGRREATIWAAFQNYILTNAQHE